MVSLSNPQEMALATEMMQAIAQTEYGSTAVLKLEQVLKPQPKNNGVLIRMKASSVNGGDAHLMRGTPFLIRVMFGGLLKPAIKTIGVDVAGIIEAAGKDVTDFQVGDEVFGDVSECGFGAFAEYVCAPPEALVHKPADMTFEEVAAVPAAAIAALQAVRDCGEIQSGQKVLINGASGGVGSFAVQIVKHFGAEVTAVCSSKKLEKVRSLGANYVMDYAEQDILKTAEQYDVVLDAAAYRPFWKYQSILKSQGTYVVIGGATAPFFQALLMGPIAAKKLGFKIKCLSMTVSQKDLLTVQEMLISGVIKPLIDRRFSLADVPKAIQHLEERRVCGKISIQI